MLHWLSHVVGRICDICGKRRGNYISILYVVVKVIYLANAIGQFFALNFFLGHDYVSYGVDVFVAMYHGDDWSESERFPRVTMCDVDVRRLGNANTYTVQCVLAINFFNEKIFLYLWCWFVVLSLMTLIGLVLLFMRIILRCDRRRYIESHLAKSGQHYDNKKAADHRMLESFVSDYLRSDGVLLVRLIGHNTTKATVSEYVNACYQHYVNLPENKKMSKSNSGGFDTSSLLTTSNRSIDVLNEFDE